MGNKDSEMEEQRVSRILHGMQSEQQDGDTVGAVWRPANLVGGWKNGRRMGASLDVKRKRQAGARFCLAGGEKRVMYHDLIMTPRKLPVKGERLALGKNHPPMDGLSATLTT